MMLDKEKEIRSAHGGPTRKLRSHAWFWGANETGLLHRGALRSMGIDMSRYAGQPIIGIASTWSEFNNCNLSLKTIADHVKAGVIEGGGIPLEFPVMSLGEELMKPSAMLYRNLLSMEVEEHLRSYPIDGVILLGNCDKTVPGLLMGAISANLPTLQLNAGPKKVGVHRGNRLGSGTDLWKYWDALRKGEIDEQEWEAVGECLSCGVGSCNTMGTASTMNGLLEAMGIMPLGLSTLPVDDQERYRLSHQAGTKIVQMVYDDVKPSDILTPNAFDNAITVCMALGGSTNAILHLTALAGRLNINVFPHKFDQIGKRVPCIVDVQPAGKKLIDEFHEAGGVPAVMKQLDSLLDLTVANYTGYAIGSLLENMPIDGTVVRALQDPLIVPPTIAVLTGTLAPAGAIIKVAAASKELLVHRGKALVFEGYADMLQRIDDPELDVEASTVLVLRYVGPKGVPGMPEWGMIPIPRKLQLVGVKDMVRISDARMSGTSFGTVILHVAPEAFEGSPLALIKNGDIISLNVPARSLGIEISKTELQRRRRQWKPPISDHKRGFPTLYIRSVLQADQGCDFDFLRPKDDSELKFIEPFVGRS